MSIVNFVIINNVLVSIEPFLQYYEKIFFNTRHYIEKYIRKTYNAIIRMLNQAFINYQKSLIQVENSFSGLKYIDTAICLSQY